MSLQRLSQHTTPKMICSDSAYIISSILLKLFPLFGHGKGPFCSCLPCFHTFGKYHSLSSGAIQPARLPGEIPPPPSLDSPLPSSKLIASSSLLPTCAHTSYEVNTNPYRLVGKEELTREKCKCKFSTSQQH